MSLHAKCGVFFRGLILVHRSDVSIALPLQLPRHPEYLDVSYLHIISVPESFGLSFHFGTESVLANHSERQFALHNTCISG